MQHSRLKAQDLHAPSNELVENTSGSSILKMRVVRFTGIGVLPKIEVISSITDVSRGITQTDIANGANGMVTSLGFMNGVNTNSFNVGDKLYASIGGSLSLVALGLPVAYVLKKDAVNGVLYVTNTGVSIDDVSAAGFPPDAELEMTWAVAYPTPYKEFSYNITGDIVDFNVYADDTKAIQVFNKNFSYDITGNLTTIITTNLLTSASKTKVIAYDGNGQMISMTES